MCRMTDIGVRGADAIDKEGLWYVSDRRVYGGQLYLFDLTEGQDMSAFRPKYRIRVKLKSGASVGRESKVKSGSPYRTPGPNGY
jgi:hypothetical protein